VRARGKETALFSIPLFSDRAHVIAETRNLLRSLENANETPFRLALVAPRNAREALIRLARRRDCQGMADDEGVSSGMTCYKR